MRERIQLAALMTPVAILFAAFFLLPLAQLVVIGGSGKLGWSAYLAVFTEIRYLKSFSATIALSLAVTLFTLAVSGIAGVFLERNRFRGRTLLTAMLTLPLAFSVSDWFSLIQWLACLWVMFIFRFLEPS